MTRLPRLDGLVPRPGRRPFHVRMRARDTDEEHRSASTLELLYDLTFVVAVAQVAVQLASAIEYDVGLAAVLPYLGVFFAIWWAWMNFTWFASAYDTDDVLYRVAALVQMGGVLVLAAGVPAAFDENDYGVVTLGYLIMRIGIIGSWVRAAVEDPANRRTAIRFAIGISLVQAGWVLRLLLPPGDIQLAVQIVLIAGELAVPVWAERRGAINWHADHIAERYGLFVILLLGESVLASTTAVRVALEEAGVTAQLVQVAGASLVILFAMWWLYFLQPAGPALGRRRDRGIPWGYAHLPLFAAIAATGAGIEAVVYALGHEVEASDTAIAVAVAVPVALVLLLVWLVHVPVEPRAATPPWATVTGVVFVLAAATVTEWIGLAGAVMVMAIVMAAVVAAAVALGRTARDDAIGTP